MLMVIKVTEVGNRSCETEAVQGQTDHLMWPDEHDLALQQANRQLALRGAMVRCVLFVARTGAKRGNQSDHAAALWSFVISVTNAVSGHAHVCDSTINEACVGAAGLSADSTSRWGHSWGPAWVHCHRCARMMAEVAGRCRTIWAMATVRTASKTV